MERMHMRRTMLCLVALLVLGACHGAPASVTVQTWTNVKSPAETLKLKRDRSVYNHVKGLLHGGFEEGQYTWTTADGTTSGSYRRSQKDKKIWYALQPTEGEKRTFVLEKGPEGSFTNERGVWKMEYTPGTRVEEKAPALVKIGG
jgi:hypothetical protein